MDTDLVTDVFVTSIGEINHVANSSEMNGTLSLDNATASDTTRLFWRGWVSEVYLLS